MKSLYFIQFNNYETLDPSEKYVFRQIGSTIGKLDILSSFRLYIIRG